MPKKGSQYERDLCKRLSNWWRGYDDPTADVLFWRTSQSGGRATFRKRQGKQVSGMHSGDICAVGKEGLLLTRLITIEIKRGYNRATANDIIDRPMRGMQQKLEEFFEQAMGAAESAGTPYWMIIHRRDKRCAVVYVPLELFGRLDQMGCFQKVPGMILSAPVSYRDKSVAFHEIVSISLESFLTSVEPRDLYYLRRQLTCSNP